MMAKLTMTDFSPPKLKEVGQVQVQVRVRETKTFTVGELILVPQGGSIYLVGPHGPKEFQRPKNITDAMPKVRDIFPRGVRAAATGRKKPQIKLELKDTVFHKQFESQVEICSPFASFQSSKKEEFKKTLQKMSPFWAVLRAARDPQLQINMEMKVLTVELQFPKITENHVGTLTAPFIFSAQIPVFTNTVALQGGEVLITGYQDHLSCLRE